MRITWILIFIMTVLPGWAQQQTTREEILSRPEWNEIYETYIPDQGNLDTLRADMPEDFRIEVYMAFWCGDSEDHVPVFLKIMDKAGAAPAAIRYHLCERKRRSDVKYYNQEFKVEKIPTFIFYKQDQEIGRFIEQPKNDILKDILKIISR